MAASRASSQPATRGRVRSIHSPNADGSRLAALVQRGGRTKQATAQLAGHLLDEGYVTLGPDATDGRAKLYVPTEAGWALLATAEQVVIGYEKWLDQMLGQDAIDQLRRILTTIVDEPARDDAPRAVPKPTGLDQ